MTDPPAAAQVDGTTVEDALWMIERSRRLIQASWAALEDRQIHIVRSEENIADAQRILALTKGR